MAALRQVCAMSMVRCLACMLVAVRWLVRLVVVRRLVCEFAMVW